MTVYNRYRLSLIQETVMRRSEANWGTKFDLKGSYNRIRIGEGEVWKTAFRSPFGYFK